jgi:type I restriction enzyme S subunit
MNEWKKYLFKDAVKFPPKVLLEKGKSYSFIPMEDINGNFKYVSPQLEKTWTGSSGTKFETGDTLFARITPCLQNGKIAQVKNLKDGIGFGSTEYFIFRGIDGISDSDFVYYISQIDEFRKYAIGSMVGASGRQRADATFVGNYEILLPPLPTQRRIASILSAYDDLIENNLKRIKLLEEIAQRTYEEWFVKFRVNGRQLIIDEKTGLPEGWRLVSVKDYSEEISKGPSLNYDNDGNKFPVINQSCIRNGEIELEKILFAQELSNNKQNCYLKINDILINSMGQGTLGRVSKNVSINERFIIHNCITFVRAKEIFSQYQLFYFLSSKQSYFEGVAQGSTGQTTLKVSLIEELEIQLAPKKLIDHFNSIIKPLWEQMGILKKQNQKLKETRDILLPKLMNGTINVE